MDIRLERTGDAPAIAELHRAAFGDHGAAVAGLVDDLRELNGLSLVADLGGQVVGHVMFSPGWLDATARLVEVQILSPVGVQPDAQGQGIASGLVRRGIDLLAGQGAPAVFLEGDPRLYHRFGFVAAGERGFRKPSLRIPDPAFQVLIMPAWRAWMTGTLVYPDAFWRHDVVGLRDQTPPPDEAIASC